MRAARSAFAWENVFVWAPALLLGGSVGAASVFEPEGLVIGFTLLGAAVIAGIAVTSDAFRRLPDSGLHTAPGRRHAKATILAVVAAPLIVVVTAGYLPWIARIPEVPRAMVFGVTAAGLGWVVLSLATRPLKELDALAAVADAPAEAGTVALPPRSVGGLLSFEVDQDEPFNLDRLGRQAQVENFCREVAEADAPMLWALDGPWGSGKSAFVRMSEAHLSNDGAAVVVFTPPVEGLTGTPLTDLVVTVSAHLAQQSKASPEESVSERTRALWALGRALGDPRILLGDFATRGANPAARLATARRLLAQHVEQSERRLVVWIDELDRCEPRYALATLQSARHLLAVPNVVTLVAVNRSALCRSIDALHGPGSADQFLDRYIDRTIPLTPPAESNYERHQLVTNLVQSWAKTADAQGWARDGLLSAALAAVGVATDLNLRDIAQIVAEFAVLAPHLPSAESYQRALPRRVGSTAPDPMYDAPQRWADTNRALLGLLILRRRSADHYGNIAARAEQLEPTPQNWQALLEEAGATVRPDEWPAPVGDGGIMIALRHVRNRTPGGPPTLAEPHQRRRKSAGRTSRHNSRLKALLRSPQRAHWARWSRWVWSLRERSGGGCATPIWWRRLSWRGILAGDSFLRYSRRLIGEQQTVSC